jgi:uncharacterized membrane protein YfcA
VSDPWWALVGAASVVAFATSALHAVVGFAFGLLSTPLFLLLLPLPPKDVVVLTVLLMLVLNACIIVPSWKDVVVGELRAIAVPVLAGLPVGAVVLAVISPARLRLVIGITLTLLAGLMLAGRRRRPRETRALPIVAGFVGGVLTTSVNFNGPPVALYLASRRLESRTFRATIAAYLMGAHALAVALFAAGGLVTAEVLGLALALMPACLAGYWVGSGLWRRMGTEAFSTLVQVLILVMGIVTIAASGSLP